MAPSFTVPTYSESIRIGWSILWRGTGSFVLLLSLGNIVMSAVSRIRARCPFIVGHVATSWHRHVCGNIRYHALSRAGTLYRFL